MKYIFLFILSVLVACSSQIDTPLDEPLAREAQTNKDSIPKNGLSFQDVLAAPYREADERWRYGSGAFHYADLWLTQNEVAPLIVFIHGGCWLNAFDLNHGRAFSSALRDAGYHVLALEYRRTGDEGGGWPGTFEDIQLAINETPKLKTRLGSNETILMGHSAGGHLSLLAASYPRSARHIDRVLALAPIIDVVDYGAGTNSCQKATASFFGGSGESMPLAYRAATPVVEASEAEVVVLFGDKDEIVPPSHVEQSGYDRQVVPGASHFDFIHPGSNAWLQVLDVLNND